MTTVGEALVAALEARGVDVIFGIPGVHTLEMYRGLAASRIRHVTPRHEQGAGFMADGYARVSGKPGVALVITGPGVTNTLTAMGQARADSIPMLVISGVNETGSLGKGYGNLHELPDQRALCALVAQSSERVESASSLGPIIQRAFDGFAKHRPGPAHIEVPLDVMAQPASGLEPVLPLDLKMPEKDAILRAAEVLVKSQRPLILAGGGTRFSNNELTALSEKLDAPVVLTVNARGLMHRHPLAVPASPSLEAVRRLIRDSDVVLALGTEFGPTDYAMYGGDVPRPSRLVRVDICADQLSRHPVDFPLQGHLAAVLPVLTAALTTSAKESGSSRAADARSAAYSELSEDMQSQVEILEAVRDAMPNAVFVGDSTQPIYAGNLYYDHDRPGGWFNAATGFGALGYGIPAAIGAALADPEASVICLTGDGGAQFTLPELMTAVDEKLPIVFLVWNNHAFMEIAESMKSADIRVVGCHPTPPDFAAIAKSCGMPFERAAITPKAVTEALDRLRPFDGPVLLEITEE